MRIGRRLAFPSPAGRGIGRGIGASQFVGTPRTLSQAAHLAGSARTAPEDGRVTRWGRTWLTAKALCLWLATAGCGHDGAARTVFPPPASSAGPGASPHIEAQPPSPPAGGGTNQPEGASTVCAPAT